MPEKILVVDDMPVNVKLLADLLTVKGYTVVTAASGAEALTKVDKEQPGLVLLDVMMPGMSGYDVCRKIRQVLLNLLSNAVKFTPEGGRVAVHAAPANGGVEISVSDTGIGIAPEDQEAIFQEFRQVGTDYARKR